MRKTVQLVRWFLLLAMLMLAPLACRDARTSTAARDYKAEDQTEAPQVAASAAPAQGPQAKLVIREATLKLRSPTPRALVQTAADLAQRFEGFVVKSETAQVDESVVEVRVSLRVRAERLDEALVELRKLGEVLNESVTGKDVTAEFVDAQARLKAKRVLEERLLTIASEANRVEDMLKVETELSRVRSDIEQLEGRSKFLKDSASLSLIQVTAKSPSQPREVDAQSFASKIGGALSQGAELAENTIVGVIVVAGFFAPLVLLALLFGLPALWWWRRRRRRALAALHAAAAAASAAASAAVQAPPQPATSPRPGTDG